MHILLLHQYFLEKDDPGGSRFNEMTQVWGNGGNKITVVAGMLNYVTGKIPSKYKGAWYHRSNYYDGVDVIRCRIPKNYNASYLGRLWAYVSFMLSSVWVGIFKAKDKYDILLITSPPMLLGISAYLLSKFKKVPFIFEVRDLWPESAIDTGVISNRLIISVAYWLERFFYQKAVLISVLTPAFQDLLITQKGVDPNKIVLIPNGSDFSFSDHLLSSFDAKDFRKTLGLNDQFVVTYVGAHGIANHLIQLIEAAELLRHSNVVFLLIGDGMEKKKLQSEALQKKLENVRFVDPVPKQEVFKYILASDLGVAVLKKVETFKTIYSNKTFDYMACKKPVLAAIDGITKDLITEANCGKFAEPENAQDIARIILDYMENPELAEFQGNNGYQYAKRHFDRMNLADQYIEYIKVASN